MKKFLVLSMALLLVFMTSCSPDAPSTTPASTTLASTTTSVVPAPTSTTTLVPPTPTSTTTSIAGGVEVPNPPVADGIMSYFLTLDLDENWVDESVLADYELTMVNVWGTFCTPCISEMPALGEIASEYKEKGFQIIGLVSDTIAFSGAIDKGLVNTAKEIVAKTKANYLHLIPAYDLHGIVKDIQSVPTTFFVDKNGVQVGGTYVGSKSKDAWKAIIDQVLAEVTQ